ncbi:MAG TPA: hypothetical protein ENK49_01450 [Gammaproteobacteria bacterium]|nr:hypothetical protein [Gammaproteobacteria bacterium]
MQDNKSSPKPLSSSKQQALRYALEREQWSSELQQRCKDHYRTEIEQLQQQLAETRERHAAARQALKTVTEERDHAQHELRRLIATREDTNSPQQPAGQDADTAPLPAPRSSGMLRRATAAAAGVLAFGALFTTVVFQDAQSHVNNRPPAETASAQPPGATQAVEHEATPGEKKKNPKPQTDKGRKKYAGLKSVRQQQWGPPLLMADDQGTKPRVVFDAKIKETQQNLLTLGFDIGKADGFNGLRTRQALAEFRALYIQDSAGTLSDSDLAVILRNYASLARADAERFGLDRGVVASIRLSSVRTGVDFSYLMKLAAAESNFEPASESANSSATGMYQFTRDTWLNTLARHGAKYGLAEYTAKIEHYTTRSGNRRPRVRDEAVYRHLLELRKNPRVASMMAAESALDNQQKLAYSFDRKPAQADLYLTHFLGAKGAIAFLKALDENPDTFAVDMFPEAARSNYGIFHPKTCAPRTVDEVYELFGKKFDTRHYDDLAAN